MGKKRHQHASMRVVKNWKRQNACPLRVDPASITGVPGEVQEQPESSASFLDPGKEILHMTLLEQAQRWYTVDQVKGLPTFALSEMRHWLGADATSQTPGETRDFEMALYLLGHPSVSKAAQHYKKSLM